MIKWHLLKNLRVAVLIINTGFKSDPSPADAPEIDFISEHMISAYLNSGLNSDLDSDRFNAKDIIQKEGKSCCFEQTVKEVFAEMMWSEIAAPENDIFQTRFHIISEKIQVLVFYQGDQEIRDSHFPQLELPEL